MSSHRAGKIDQKEYLKKYLSGDKQKKKKKDKKQKKHSAAKVKIIDDDAFANQEDVDEELLLGGEDAPQIVGEYIQELANGANATKWRSITVKDEPADTIKEEGKTENDLWGQKAAVKKVKDEFSPGRRKNRQQTPDISPPRRSPKNSPPRRYKKSPDISATRRHNQSPDISPPRKNKRSPNNSPKRSRKFEHKSPSRSIQKHSPPHRTKRSTDYSPSTRQNREKSPMRRHRKSASNECEEKLRRHGRSNSNDPSPLRRRNNRTNGSGRGRDSSPAQRNRTLDQLPSKRNDKINTQRRRSNDQSPPRRLKRSNSKDQNPTRRKQRVSADNSPPRRIERSQSPVRQHRRTSSDLSPSRRQKFANELPTMKREKLSPPSVPSRKSRWMETSTVSSPSPPPTHKQKAKKTLDGKKAGLQDAESLKTETDQRRRQEERLFAQMSRDVSGRDADVQVRSTGRRGQRARDAANEDPEVQRRKEAHEQKKKDLYDRWGAGLKQIEDHRERNAEMLHESNKPLARYANDEDLEQHLRDQERADDPMLEYMRQKKQEQQKKSNIPTLPVYQGSYPENRFGIRPGYRWDGVDRSNGYETKWFDVQNEKRALQDEAYKYSVEDM